MINLSNQKKTFLESIDANYYDKTGVSNADYKPVMLKKCGTLDEKSVPVYSYLKFGFTPYTSGFYIFVDNKGREVMLFRGSEGNPNTISYFKAYRYSSAQGFVFINDRLKPTFLLENEYITDIEFVSNHYVIATVTTYGTTTTTRLCLLKTFNDFDETKWQLIHDLTATLGLSSHIYRTLIVDNVYNRLIVAASVNASNQIISWGAIKLFVYDLSNLALLGTTQIFDLATNMNISAYTVTSKTVQYYGLRGLLNTSNGDFLLYMTLDLYYTNVTSNRATKSFVLSLNLDNTFRNAGTGGTITYHIPVNSTNYDFFASSTIALSTLVSTHRYSMTYNEYNNSFYMILRSWWNDINSATTSRTWTTVTTAANHNAQPLLYSQNIQVIDSSPYAKKVQRRGFFIDNYVLNAGQSTKFNGTVNFISKCNFNTPNIDYVPGEWRNLSTINPNANITITDYARWAVYKSGSTVKHYIYDTAWKIFEITIDTNFGITYTDTGKTLPLPPSGSYTRRAAWGYDPSTNIYYWVCQDLSTQGRHVVVWTDNNGSTWNKSPEIGAAVATQSGTSYGDNIARFYIVTNMLVENNTAYTGISYYIVGSATSFVFTGFDKVANTVTTIASNGYQWDSGGSLGYHPTQGYYISTMFEDWRITFVFNSSITNLLTGVSNTTKYLTCSASAGLSATVSNSPMFLNGYYYQLPLTDVVLSPSTSNYIYVTAVNKNTINISREDTLVADTDTKVLIAKVITDTGNPISQELYEIVNDPIPDYLSFKIKKILNLSISSAANVTYTATTLGVTTLANAVVLAYLKVDSNTWKVDTSLTISVANDNLSLTIQSAVGTARIFNIIIMVNKGDLI